jgi:3-hydroxybutyryl-CoA dehydrogenase
MENAGNMEGPLLLTGNGKLTFSIAVCLLQAGRKVILHTDDSDDALLHINTHCADLKMPGLKRNRLEIIDRLAAVMPYSIAIAITSENLAEKKHLIDQLEKSLPGNAIIAINSESILLSAIQQDAVNPGRIVGANWSEPAHTTWFLELIVSAHTKQESVDALYYQAKIYWKKDPYIISGDSGIRAKMLSAITREAFYLVENGYASIEDIDRACRNDPGYYLSFAGNFRYMDLMGASGYGEVMKGLNPELSTARQVPEFFEDIIRQGHLGMESSKGFYEYREGEVNRWEETFRKYTYQIREIIEKYPFGYLEDNV